MKRFVFCAAVFAAASVSMIAQSNVYSLNIVGYANVRVGGGNDIYANVFDLDGVNSADKILNHAALSDAGGNPGLDQFYVNTWNGHGFDSVYFEQDFTSANTGGAVTNGWATDGGGSTQGIPPNLPPGKGFFINNGGPVVTNIFVGNVVPAPGTTNSLVIVGGNQLISSPLPVEGRLTDPQFQFPMAPLSDTGGNPGLDQFYVNTWNGHGFNSVYYEQDFTSNNTGGAVTNGWATDGGGAFQGYPPFIRVGQGFFLNNGGPVVPWKQTLTNSP